MAKKRAKKTAAPEPEVIDRGIGAYWRVRNDRGDVMAELPIELFVAFQEKDVRAICAEAAASGSGIARGLAEMLLLSVQSGNIESAALFGYRLGRTMQWLTERPHEPAALTGRKARQSLDDGRQSRRTKAEITRIRNRRRAEIALAAAAHTMMRDGKSVEHQRGLWQKRAARYLGITPKALRKRKPRNLGN